MFRKTLSSLLVIAVFGLLPATELSAQSAPTKQEKKTAKVREKIKKLGSGEAVRIKVKLYNDSSYQGYIKEANEDDFAVVDKSGTSHIVKYSDVNSIGGKNLSTGAKIAIGVGIGAGATLLILYLVFISLND